MARKKKDGFDEFLDSFYTSAKGSPWWVGLIFVGFVFAVVGIALPAALVSIGGLSPNSAVIMGVAARLVRIGAYVLTGLLVLVWFVALRHRYRDWQMLEVQTGAESLRGLSWREFERLLAEAFRREGYAVEDGGGQGPDGGVDLRLRRGSRVVLVQCKHWKAWKVDVKVVRELRGVMAVEGATGGIVVTSGRFTAEAEAFARESGIRLVDGAALLPLIRSVQKSPRVAVDSDGVETPVGQAPGAPSPTPTCPRCGGVMVVKMARRGRRAGSEFWGCKTFPRCRGTVDI